MTAATLTVRVLPARALTLRLEDSPFASSVLHVAGGELELPADEAKQLVEQGFVEPA